MSAITVLGDYLNDPYGRYFASRVLQYQKDPYTGMPYEIAITTGKTTRESIDYWLEVMAGRIPMEPNETDVETALYAALFQQRDKGEKGGKP